MQCFLIRQFFDVQWQLQSAKSNAIKHKNKNKTKKQLAFSNVGENNRTDDVKVSLGNWGSGIKLSIIRILRTKSDSDKRSMLIFA